LSEAKSGIIRRELVPGFRVAQSGLQRKHTP
jgi:hypothetical protein